jgi:hypothetical protein
LLSVSGFRVGVVGRSEAVRGRAAVGSPGRCRRGVARPDGPGLSFLICYLRRAVSGDFLVLPMLRSGVQSGSVRLCKRGGFRRVEQGGAGGGVGWGGG